MPARKELPSTIRRSPPKAQRTWIKAHDSAVEKYGEGERAHRSPTPRSSTPSRGWATTGSRSARGGPSDPRAEKGGKQAREGKGETFGGVDYYGHTKEELLRRARRLGVEGASRMNKKELAWAIARKQTSQGRQRRAA